MLKPNEAANKLNVSVKTLQRWDREGILKAQRTPTDRRFYTEEQIQQFTSKSKESDVYKFLFYEAIIDYYGDDYEKADNLIQENKNKGLFFIAEEQIVYKVNGQKELATLFNVPVDYIENNSNTLKKYIGFFDGGEYIEVLNMQISRACCIDYLLCNLNVYIDRINNAIEKLSENEEYLNNEILNILNDILSEIVKEEVDECLKELKNKSKTGNFEWK